MGRLAPLGMAGLGLMAEMVVNYVKAETNSGGLERAGAMGVDRGEWEVSVFGFGGGAEPGVGDGGDCAEGRGGRRSWRKLRRGFIG